MPKLKLLAKGKVRDIYALPDKADEDKLLFVATDRISAFDFIMDNVSLSIDSGIIAESSLGHSKQRCNPHFTISLLVRQARTCHPESYPRSIPLITAHHFILGTVPPQPG